MRGTNVACEYYVVNRLSTGRYVCSNTVSIVIPADVIYTNITLYNRITVDPSIVTAYNILRYDILVIIIMCLVLCILNYNYLRYHHFLVATITQGIIWNLSASLTTSSSPKYVY